MIEIKGIDPEMIANNTRPAHPGELLRDEIEFIHISQKQLAADMGVSNTVLNDIVDCRRPEISSLPLCARLHWVFLHTFS